MVKGPETLFFFDSMKGLSYRVSDAGGSLFAIDFNVI